MKQHRGFQIHLSTCLILTLLSGVLMAVYFQFSRLLASSNFFADFGDVQFAIQSSFIAFSVSILCGTAYLCEKAIAAPAPAPIRTDRQNS